MVSRVVHWVPFFLVTYISILLSLPPLLTVAIKAESIIIIGGGIIGSACAYYISQERKVKVTLIERDSIACAASGKAGGFLAKGWGDGDTGPLHELSFDLHAKLAEDLGIASYRKIPTLQVTANQRRAGTGRSEGKAASKSTGSASLPAWIDGESETTDGRDPVDIDYPKTLEAAQ